MKNNDRRARLPLPLSILLTTLALGFGASAPATAQFGLIELLHSAQAEHVDQADLYNLVASGQDEQAFDDAFEEGDELFETVFNILDGVGANVGNGQRFTRIPRADLTGADEWASHFPRRETGPNAQACNSCHNLLFDDGAGETATNVHRDPTHSGSLESIIQRNTPHVFASGAIQRVAEEMTVRLHRLRDLAAGQACSNGSGSRRLFAKGVNFGVIVVNRTASNPCQVAFDTSGITGVDDDLVVKPFQWKGNEPTLRSFNRGAGHNELGMQAVELVGYGVDGDFDGVVDEFTVGDMTALAIYLAAQPRPTTKMELSALGLIPALSASEKYSILRGGYAFGQLGCDGCHRPLLRIQDPTFSEPSQVAAYRDAVFPAGQDPLTEWVDPDVAVTFDLTRDQPDNLITLPNGNLYRLGALERDHNGRGLARIFSDLKRHDMGAELSEPIDEQGTGPSVWITKELWGVGSSAPYLHDGSATTLTEAILAHSGEATGPRQAFINLPQTRQSDLIAFLDNLVLFKLPDE